MAKGDMTIANMQGSFDRGDVPGSGLFYTGQGVISHKKVDYGYGAELPADVPDSTIERLRARGLVSESAPERKRAGGSDPRVAVLQGQLLDAQNIITEMGKAAQDGSAEIDRLRNELATSQATIQAHLATIDQLTAQITNGGAGADGGAGPKK